MDDLNLGTPIFWKQPYISCRQQEKDDDLRRVSPLTCQRLVILGPMKFLMRWDIANP